jgi:hypothetical protein
MRSIPFSAYHAVNFADPENWKQATVDRGDGKLIDAFQYQMPAAEQALTAPAETRLAAKNTEREMLLSLPFALRDKSKSTPDFLSRAAAWAQSVDLNVTDSDEDDDVFEREDWRIRARVTAAALIMRDGDDALRTKHQPWVEHVLKEALAKKGDPYHSHPLLPYNTVAIAAVGQINIVRRGPSEPGFRSLLEIAARSDQAMLSAFSAELSALQDIDARLPRAIMRIGFASCIHALHDYRESDEAYKARVAIHQERSLAAIGRELAWLRGDTGEPDWPVFPAEPPRRKRYIRLGRTVDEPEEKRERPKDVVYSGGAAKWIQVALPLLGNDTMAWFRGLVDAYADWTSVENGAGQGEDVEADRSSLEWNMTYFDLVPRTFTGMTPDEINRGVLGRVLTFPEESLFDATAVLIRTLDELYFNGKVMAAEEALRLRTFLSDELRRRRGWERVVERQSSLMEMHLARAVSSLFMHNESWGGGKCYLYPPAADSLKVFLPLLSGISVEAAQSQYIAAQFLDLMELKVNPENLSHLVVTASAWMAKYPDDIPFWVDHGIGKRICAWLAESMTTYPDAFAAPTCPSAQMESLIDSLVRLGVATARGVEENFARIRKAAA